MGQKEHDHWTCDAKSLASSIYIRNRFATHTSGAIFQTVRVCIDFKPLCYLKPLPVKRTIPTYNLRKFMLCVGQKAYVEYVQDST